jgi:hypothetical protein
MVQRDILMLCVTSLSLQHITVTIANPNKKHSPLRQEHNPAEFNQLKQPISASFNPNDLLESII